jgi:hypothetical protein
LGILRFLRSFFCIINFSEQKMLQLPNFLSMFTQKNYEINFFKKKSQNSIFSQRKICSFFSTKFINSNFATPISMSKHLIAHRPHQNSYSSRNFIILIFHLHPSSSTKPFLNRFQINGESAH